MGNSKGINLVERHVEKVVLGVVGLVFVGVLAMQFAGGTTKVTVDNQELDPEAAMERIADKARSLRLQVEEGSPDLPAAPVLALEERWTRGRTPTTALAIAPLIRPQGPGRRDDGALAADAPISGDYKYPELIVRAPSRPLLATFRTTLDPFEVASNSDLRDIVGSSQPFDVAAVSIEATFDSAALREALSSDPDGDGRDFSPIPIQWWRDNVEILEVEIERAEWSADGSLGSVRAVGALPGRKTLRELVEMPEAMSAEDLDELVGFAREDAGLVREPKFYRSIAGRPWMSPADFARLDEIDAQKQEIQRLVRQHGAIGQDIEQARQALANLGQNPGGLVDPRQGDPRGGGDTRGQDTRRPTGRDQQDDPQARRINERIDRLLLDQERVKLQLEDFGVDEKGDAIVGRPGEDAEFVDPLLESESVRLLAHDVRVEAGRSYVYRVRAILNNPLFGHGQQLHDDQRALASQATIASEWSDWSEPIEVLGDRYFFVTSASEGDTIGGPRASVEVYQFWYGYWRKGTAAIEPGDAIMTELALPDANLLPIFDMAMIERGIPPRQDDRRGPQPGQRDRGPRIDPAADPNDQFSDPALLDQGRRSRARPPADEVGALPEGATPAEPLPPITIESVLLDVAPIAGVDREFRAMFREVSGAISARLPRLETSDPLYERVKESAAEGLRQGLPEPEPEPEPDPIVRQPRDRTPPPRSDPGGGGGG